MYTYIIFQRSHVGTRALNAENICEIVCESQSHDSRTRLLTCRQTYAQASVWRPRGIKMADENTYQRRQLRRVVGGTISKLSPSFLRRA